MFFSTRAKGKIILSLVFVLVSVFVQGQTTHAASPAARSSSAYQSTRETLVKAGMVDPMRLPKGKAHSTSTNVYGLFHGTIAPARASNTGLPLAKTIVPPIVHRPGPNILGAPLQKFNGISSRDSIQVTGQHVNPPDQGLCVSSGFVVETVNLAVTIYSHRGQALLGPVSLQGFFHESPQQYLTDPECYFDPATNAWFVIVGAIGPGARSHMDIAVNPSGNPTTPWVVYILGTTDGHHHGCPCFGDEPRIGIDQFNLYIDTDEFTITRSPRFLDAQIYAISKSQLVALASVVNLVLFFNLAIAGGPAVAVQPAISIGNPNAEYFLSSFAGLSSASQLGVWALTNGGAVTSGGTVTLSNVVTNTQQYAQPPLALNPNGNALDTDDDRMQQVESINNEIWGALSGGYVANNTALSGVAWFIIDPILSSNGQTIQSASVRDQNAFVVLDNYLLYPAIEASPTGTAVLVMTMTSPGYNPGLVYFVRQDIRQGQFEPSIIAPALGVAAYNCASQTGVECRWGDYSAAAIDPSSGVNSIWVATEYVPDAGPEVPNWGTYLVQVQM